MTITIERQYAGNYLTTIKHSSLYVALSNVYHYRTGSLLRSTDDILADDIVNIDICKAYLSVLLHSTTPMPICSIHNKVEPFGCKSDLSQCREFYLDTTTIHNYKTSITIEAGWYSANLVKHLVERLNIPTASITYKLNHDA